MVDNAHGRQQRRQRWRYRTFVLLSTIAITGAGVLTTALVTLARPQTNWRFYILVSLGIGMFQCVMALLAWRTRHTELERAGFRW